jgi:hypothetical protein
MTQIFGEYTEETEKSREFLKLGFTPSLTQLQQRWRNNGLSADFLADYLTTFFPTDDNDPSTIQRATELKGAVSYIANELLENSMKFHNPSDDYPVTLQVKLYNDHLVLCVTNSITPKNIIKFQSVIHDLEHIDPQELYVRQIKRASENEGNSSGLGLLTIIDDYQAKIGWKFETIQTKKQPEQIIVTTMVQLSL